MCINNLLQVRPEDHRFTPESKNNEMTQNVTRYNRHTRKGGPAVQDDVSGLQLAFVVKHHGVDPRYGVVLDHTRGGGQRQMTLPSMIW